MAFLLVLFRFVFAAFVTSALNAQSIAISSSKNTVNIGDTTDISVIVDGNYNNVTVWPFINNSQWSADQPLMYNSTSKTSTTVLHIPFPFVGESTIQVAILNGSLSSPFTVGLPMPSNIIKLKSNILNVNVVNSHEYMYNLNIRNSSSPSNVLLFFESWFTPSHHNWHLAEAIPIVGRYSSYDTSVMKQHVLWFNNIGINGIVLDWTNNLYGKTSWSQRSVIAQEMINATTDLLEYYSELRKDNVLTPSIVLLLGMCNGGKNTTINALDQEIEWITNNYYKKYSDLFLQHDDGPLLIIWDGCDQHYKDQSINNTLYTIRWMTAHLNSNTGACKGFFSWMDGSLNPVPTYVKNCTHSGPVESLTITTAFFGTHGGWLSPTEAVATNNGATLLQEGQSAARYSPQLLFVNQWNEFAGNSESSDPSKVYLDIYNSTLGNDIEPTSLTQCGYPRPDNAYCGGWGFRQLNILKAIIYNTNVNPNSYFMVIKNPVPWTTYSKSYNNGAIQIEWIILGICKTKQFQIYVDNKSVANVSVQIYNTNIKTLSNGKHEIRIVSFNCKSPVELAANFLSPISNPGTLTKDTVQFVIQN